jgi:hypothetical protein
VKERSLFPYVTMQLSATPIQTGEVSPQIQEDLRLMAKWVREDLFKNVKFLYRGKATLDGTVFKRFREKLLDSLPGMKIASATHNDLAKKLYLEGLWAAATQRNTVSNALALRRSGVYTVMQNRFNGTYKGSSFTLCFFF